MAVSGCVKLVNLDIEGQRLYIHSPMELLHLGLKKNYPIDYSHFTIMGTCVGAKGIEPDSDKAIFPNVNLETKIGHNKGIKLKLPFIIPGLGSTSVAKNNWDGLAIGAAISGVPLTIGENICGMDMGSEIKGGKVVHSPELEWRIKSYTE